MLQKFVINTMNRNFLLLMLMVAVTGFISCNRTTNMTDSSEPASIGDNSRNAIDWEGTYRGTIPCADCEGIETEISLTYEETYVIKTKYLGKDSQVFISEGRFEWNELGSSIALDSKSAHAEPLKFLVGENRLFQLDVQGNRITGPLAEHYILEKVSE